MKKIGSLLYISIFMFIGCADNENNSRSESEEDKLVEEAVAPIKEHHEKAYYPIPSPEQMFGFINDNGVDYSKALMNSSTKAENYINPTEKALNFGVYTADLAYAAAYQDIGSTIELYKVVKQLGSELHIEDMMTEEMMLKVQTNMENPDSLALIAGDSYYQAVEYLEENGQEGKLALMSLGGWVESLHITMSAISGIEPSSATADRIAAQKITFGNLYTYLKKNEDKVGVSEAIEEIQDIRSVLGSLMEERSAKTSNDSKGKLVLGRGNKINMTKEQFEQLKDAISVYRSKIVGTDA